MSKTFLSCALIASLLLLCQTVASAQGGANAKDPAQGKSSKAQKPEAGRKAEAGAKSERAEEEEKKCAAAVLLQAVLHSSGEVKEIKVLKFTPEDFPEKEKDAFTLKAVESAGRLKFQPAQKDGRPVSQRIKLEYCFDLN